MAKPSDRELDTYRDRIDRFVADLDQEYYDHFAGLKTDFDLESIYRNYEDITSLEQAQKMSEAVDGSFGMTELWRFACEGYLGALTRRYEQDAATTEATLTATVDGDEVPFRMLRPTIANSEDRDRRERIERLRNELTEEHINPILLAGARETHDAVRALGASTYRELYDKFDYKLDALAEQCRDFLDSTEALYEDAADRLFRSRVGVGLSEAQRWDVARVFRASEWDPVFPADKMLPALDATLQELGIKIYEQANVHIDVEERPHKTPRAFCSPIEVPGKVMLVIQPMGGPDDWRALFHEAGHVEHFANTRAELKVEERRLGDSAVTEGWAMLLQHLTDDPVWLSRRLDFPRPEVFAAEGAANLLFFVRRYSAKLLYELEFHSAADITTMRPRYVELLGDALKIEPSPVDYLGDIDSSFYVTSYLRSWAFEAQMRAHLRGEFGNAWFARRETGSLLRELWGEGQRWPAEAFLKDVTGSTIELEAVADRVREHLALV
ncbi:MAG: gluzincin family metallopeptidase [Gaiellaceae bacterium]